MARLNRSDIRARLRVAAAATALLFPLLWGGCNTSGCLENQSAIPLAGFYSSATGEAATLNILRIHGVGAPGDSAILASGTAANQVYLPMRSTATSTEWCIAYTQQGIDKPEFNDTITFRYSSIPYFASEECGAMYYYRISSVETSTNLIDSVTVVDSLVTNADRISFKIYFRIGDEPSDPDIAI